MNTTYVSSHFVINIARVLLVIGKDFIGKAVCDRKLCYSIRLISLSKPSILAEVIAKHLSNGNFHAKLS